MTTNEQIASWCGIYSTGTDLCITVFSKYLACPASKSGASIVPVSGTDADSDGSTDVGPEGIAASSDEDDESDEALVAFIKPDDDSDDGGIDPAIDVDDSGDDRPVRRSARRSWYGATPIKA